MKKYYDSAVFNQHTSFAINPERISVIESLYPGCIEVHLSNYVYNSRITPAGGTGLAIAGNFASVSDGSLYGRLALISGFLEVFEIISNYDDVVVLRPTDRGLGINWKLFQEFTERKSSKQKLLKTWQLSAQKHQRKAQSLIQKLTGSLAGQILSDNGPFFLQERTKLWSSETAIVAHTVEQAKVAARRRINELMLKGWNCGEESCLRGTPQKPKASTVVWICQKYGPDKWLRIRCGTPDVPPEGELLKKSFKVGDTLTAAKIREMSATWAHFDGFSGEHCSKCLADANVLAFNDGWLCGCGHYNCQSWSHHQHPHQYPDYGPSQAVISEGMKDHAVLRAALYLHN